MIEYNPEDPVSLSFIVSAANIFAYSFGLDYCHDIEKIKKMSKNVVLPKFEIKKIVIKEDNANTIVTEEKSEDDEQIIKRIGDKLKSFI